LLTCIYDPTTKMLVGGRSAAESPLSCTGVGKDLPRVCDTLEAYPVPAMATDDARSPLVVLLPELERRHEA
jgi:hypothetical protein